MARPFRSLPSMARTAASIWSSAMSTKPKPLGRPEPLVGTVAPEAPNGANAAWRSASDTSNERFPTKSRLLIILLPRPAARQGLDRGGHIYPGRVGSDSPSSSQSEEAPAEAHKKGP